MLIELSVPKLELQSGECMVGWLTHDMASQCMSILRWTLLMV
jgi:hypothetical protein